MGSSSAGHWSIDASSRIGDVRCVSSLPRSCSYAEGSRSRCVSAAATDALTPAVGTLISSPGMPNSSSNAYAITSSSFEACSKSPAPGYSSSSDSILDERAAAHAPGWVAAVQGKVPPTP
eukprot:scaffold303469_cov30-Tisochrysis_lutea.AAC.3